MKLLLGLLRGAIALAAVVALPAMAQSNHYDTLSLQRSSSEAGVSATYTIDLRPHWYNNASSPAPEVISDPIPAGRSGVTIGFPAGFDLSGAAWDSANSLLGVATGGTVTFPGPSLSASNVVIDNVARVVRIQGLDQPLANPDPGGAGGNALRIVITGVVNPPTSGAHSVGVGFNYLAFVDGQEYQLVLTAVSAPINAVPGVVLGATPVQSLVYASEIIATAAAPVTLANLGPQNLRVPLSYNFSSSEVRHARLECGSGMTFLPGTAVAGGGATSVGAVNGLGTGAITFSLTAGAGGASAASHLNVTGDRRIVGTDPVDCTYSLYDFPSQAQAGGSAGRVATVSGPYLRFAPSTAFASVGRASTADVEADPSYSRFLVSAPTTAGVAALSRLTYGLAAPAPLTAAGTAITLGSLHATGASGTRIVAAGDFTAAANADGSYTGAALDRVYLSTSNANCTAVGIPAATLSATQATFPVGATAIDRLLCLAPRAVVAIPAADYTATLDAVSVAPTVYAVADIGPLAAGAIVRNGTQLQAPLVQVPGNWLARVVLTNTGNTERQYTITTLDAANEDNGAAGKKLTLDGALLSGTIPANGTKVIRLDDAVLDLATGGRRGTVIVTVNGPNNQIQGLYQVVNPSNGLVNNHVLVRPGSN